MAATEVTAVTAVTVAIAGTCSTHSVPKPVVAIARTSALLRTMCVWRPYSPCAALRMQLRRESKARSR